MASLLGLLAKISGLVKSRVEVIFSVHCFVGVFLYSFVGSSRLRVLS